MAIKLLDESMVNEDKGSYVVKRVIFDVAFKDKDHAKSFTYGGGAGNRDVSNAIAQACENAGYELAGDIIETTDDLTDIYRSDDYDFYGKKDYLVKRVEIDVAARDEDQARKLNNGSGAPGQFSGSIFNELEKALEKCGYEMAGDQCSVEDDFTDVYKDNDYEFFDEGCKKVTESESDEYKSYRDQWNKNYKGKNRSKKEVDNFITSAWNELNHGENNFTGDEFKQLCKDAGVDSKKYMKESDVDDDFSVAFIKDNGEEVLRFFNNFDDAMDLVNNLTSDEKLVYNDCGPQFKEKYRKLEDDHYDLANPKDAEDIDLKLTASLSAKTYGAVEALQGPRFRMKLRELVGGFGAELNKCSVDETNPLED